MFFIPGNFADMTNFFFFIKLIYFIGWIGQYTFYKYEKWIQFVFYTLHILLPSGIIKIDTLVDFDVTVKLKLAIFS